MTHVLIDRAALCGDMEIVYEINKVSDLKNPFFDFPKNKRASFTFTEPLEVPSYEGVFSEVCFMFEGPLLDRVKANVAIWGHGPRLNYTFEGDIGYKISNEGAATWLFENKKISNIIYSQKITDEFLYHLEQDGHVIMGLQMEAIFRFLQILYSGKSYFEKCPRATRRRLQREHGTEKGDEYYMLSINSGAPQKGSSAAGEGQKKRYHFCRGHYRDVGQEKPIWVKPHWRGDKDLGIISKGYAYNAA